MPITYIHAAEENGLGQSQLAARVECAARMDKSIQWGGHGWKGNTKARKRLCLEKAMRTTMRTSTEGEALAMLVSGWQPRNDSIPYTQCTNPRNHKHSLSWRLNRRRFGRQRLGAARGHCNPKTSTPGTKNGPIFGVGKRPQKRCRKMNPTSAKP